MTVIAGHQLIKTVGRGSAAARPLLQGVDLQVEAGERVAIVGRSGSGKSTLLSLLGLLSRPTGGTVVIDGVSTTALSDGRAARLRRAKLGFVFQNYSLIGHLSVASNVALPLRLDAHVTAAVQRERVAEVLELVGMGDRGRSRPKELSGGEQQRVAIARALVSAPPIVLADEPTGALDTDTGGVVLRCLLEQTQSRGTALVLVTHDDMVAAAADRVLRLADGRLHPV